jgi:general stress protein CsbA
MLVVLGGALLCGLVGFAFHTLWIVAIVILALGLGYVVANTRRDRREVVERDLLGSETTE